MLTLLLPSCIRTAFASALDVAIGAVPASMPPWSLGVIGKSRLILPKMAELHRNWRNYPWSRRSPVGDGGVGGVVLDSS